MEIVILDFFCYGEIETNYLMSKDPTLGAAIERIGPIQRPVIPDLFMALVRAIVAQQISSKAASTVWQRMQDRFQIITPAALAASPVDIIQQCGMSNRKAGYIQGAAAAVEQGEMDLAALSALADDEVTNRLSSLPGVGVWTAEMLMIFSMQRPDVVSWGDLGIRRGMKTLYGLESLDKAQFETYRHGYKPFGSVASLYLWHIAME